MRVRSKVMLILMVVLLAVILVFALLPSTVRRRFSRIEQDFLATLAPSQGLFTLEELEDKPQVVRNFFLKGGYIGKPKMSGLKAVFEKADFSLGQGKDWVVITYTQLNGAEQPLRYAQILSSIHHLPFEGLDSYAQGVGAMEGYLAKFFRLFNQKGEHMDRACLVTYLAEAFFLPSVALSPLIEWEELSPLEVKATIRAFGMEGSGVFTFAETGEMLSFTTDDRMAAGFDGSLQKVRWTAECSDYRMVDGFSVPSTLKATWHYPEGDLTYFDGKDVKISYLY